MLYKVHKHVVLWVHLFQLHSDSTILLIHNIQRKFRVISEANQLIVDSISWLKKKRGNFLIPWRL